VKTRSFLSISWDDAADLFEVQFEKTDQMLCSTICGMYVSCSVFLTESGHSLVGILLMQRYLELHVTTPFLCMCLW
jgi:hypothetical protein